MIRLFRGLLVSNKARQLERLIREVFGFIILPTARPTKALVALPDTLVLISGSA
jgi:hypothetical protein